MIMSKFDNLEYDVRSFIEDVAEKYHSTILDATEAIDEITGSLYNVLYWAYLAAPTIGKSVSTQIEDCEGRDLSFPSTSSSSRE